MSSQSQEVVIYLLNEKDLNKPIEDRTVVCVCSTIPPHGQKLENQVVDEIIKKMPPPSDSTEEQKQAYRDMLYMQSIALRASGQLARQMPGKYLTLRMAIIDGPMAGTVIYSETYPTHIDPAQIRQMEGGMTLKAEHAGKLH